MNEHVALKPREAGYDTDFYAWAMQQAELLRAGRLDLVDIENIAEEIESLGRSDRRAVGSHLVVLIEHLLKLKYSEEDHPRGKWRQSVRNARRETRLILQDSPSLYAQRDTLFAESWRYGVEEAKSGVSEIEATLIQLAASKPAFTIDQALDPDFFPPQD